MSSLFSIYLMTMSLCGLDALTCGRHSCHGDVGNLAAGRDVYVSSTCNDDESNLYCSYRENNCSTRECKPCIDGVSGFSHPGSHILDSPFAKNKTHWQSKLLSSDKDKVIVRFDLETAFYFTHLIMIFKSPRPAAMILEKSVDFGKTWQVYQHYAANCMETFKMSDDVETSDARCTSKYSDSSPCTGGEVIYRVLNPVDPIDDPYSAESKHLLKITNLRVQMWGPQYCTECHETEDVLKSFRHFAVYDMIVRGTCFCNGHADSCVPLETAEFEPRDTKRAVVHGKCICEHNTAGDHCEKCMPLYNDAPWTAGNGFTGRANPCHKCNCHGHSESCHFDNNIWTLTGQVSGGVCDHCKHNTEGRRCDRCKNHFFRRQDAHTSDPDVCQACECNSIGVVSMEAVDQLSDVDIKTKRLPLPCDPVTGQCRCKGGVMGRRCDRCSTDHWGLNEDGCKKCLCSPPICDQVSGECIPDYGDDDDGYFFPVIYEPHKSRHVTELRHDYLSPRYPDYTSYSPAKTPLHKGMAASWRRPGSCFCKEKQLDSVSGFCNMKYDYAVKVRVLGAEDDGTTTVISVAIKRIIKQNKVKIRKGKMFMFPESWTVMGCTCPALIPRSDYIVVGHEEPITGRLMVNMNSFVKRWNQTKNWARIIHRIFRSKCD